VIVADASIALKWVVREPYSTEARLLLGATLDANQAVIVPRLLPFEVLDSIYQRLRRGGVSVEQGKQLWAAFLAFPFDFVGLLGLHERALEIADAFGPRAAYDAHYVALAEALGCDLWTDDQRLLRALGGALPFVRWIGGYQPNGSV